MGFNILFMTFAIPTKIRSGVIVPHVFLLIMMFAGLEVSPVRVPVPENTPAWRGGFEPLTRKRSKHMDDADEIQKLKEELRKVEREKSRLLLENAQLLADRKHEREWELGGPKLRPKYLKLLTVRAHLMKEWPGTGDELAAVLKKAGMTDEEIEDLFREAAAKPAALPDEDEADA